MIQGCVICFNDTPALIERCITSLKTVVDKVLVVDGAFATYPHDKPFSTDGTLEKAKELADKVIETDSAWRSQIDKRNKYLTLKDETDYYLWLDTDEYIEGELPKDLKDDYYAIQVVTNGIPEYQFRLFRHQKGIKYKKKHSWVWVGNDIVSQDVTNANIIKLEGVQIIHTPNARTEDNIARDTVYIAERKENQTEPEDITPHIIPKPFKGITMIALEYYGGWDGNRQITVQANEEFEVSDKKCKQLEEDFPTQFRRKV